MGIFLTYGLSLGFVGSGAGMVAGLLFVLNINKIAGLLGRLTGQQVFKLRPGWHLIEYVCEDNMDVPR